MFLYPREEAFIPDTMETILLTGAAGIVGTALRPLMAKKYPKVLLTDIRPIAGLANNEVFQEGDITDLGFVRSLMEGICGVVHLAGMVGHYTFDEVLGPNFVGTYNIFEAARQAGVPRVIYASSHHAVGFYKRGERHIDHSTAPRPDSFYGLSKAFGEEIGSLYADKYGIKSFSIRIGYVGKDVPDERRMHTWVSPRDLAQLVHIGLTMPGLHHEVVYGVSNVPEPFFDNSNAFRLGYQPEDTSLDHLANPSIQDEKHVDGALIGGNFATSDR